MTARGEALLTDGRLLTTDHDPDQLQLRTARSRPGWIELTLALRNGGRHPLQVEQLRPLVAPDGWGVPRDGLRASQTGWQSWSQAHPPLPLQANLESAAPPIRGPILPHRHPDSLLVPWMSLLTAPDGRALLLGFLSAERQHGSIEVLADGAIVAATELEGVSLQPGLELRSEPLLIATGDPSHLPALYARRVAEVMSARPTRDVPSGWCSWYQLFTDVTAADVRRNLARISEARERIPIELVQLDDGYERAIGDWLDLKGQFGDMAELTADIRARGYEAGLWLAPFLLSARSRTYAEHPDWVVHDAEGQPLNAISNWGAANFCLDTTHPDALAWLEHIVRTVCDAWGYEYLKLDFLYAGALRGRRQDPAATSVQAYRRGLSLIRRVVGERFLLGCGAPLLPSIGLVDGMRVGADVAPFWGRQPDPAAPSMTNALRATLARGWMHRAWWINDPDCLLLRANDTDLTLTEVHAWAAVVALSGGMVLAGDDLSRLEPERLSVLSRLLPPYGQAADAGGRLTHGIPERLHLRVRRSWDEWSIAGLANWRDEPVRLVFDPAEWPIGPSAYHLFDLWTGEHVGPVQGPCAIGTLDAHALRLLSVHADLGRPQVVGSTGHLLGEAMDLADVTWGDGSLVLALSQARPAARTGEVVVADQRRGLARLPFGPTTTDLRWPGSAGL